MKKIFGQQFLAIELDMCARLNKNLIKNIKYILENTEKQVIKDGKIEK